MVVLCAPSYSIVSCCVCSAVCDGELVVTVTDVS